MTDLKNIDLGTQKSEKTEKGASMVEYALLVALIAIVAIVAVSQVGANASTRFNQIANSLGVDGADAS